MSRHLRHSGAQRGFTIIELLIAVTVFSMVLILITTGVLRFTRQYYKGVIEGQTQDVARSIIDDITRSVQFSDGSVATIYSGGNPVAYCLGSAKRYRVYLNSEVTDSTPLGPHQHRHALVSDNYPNCNGSTPATDVQDATTLTDPNAREMLGAHMRLGVMSITGNSDVWTVDVRVIYGDDDLLCDPSLGVNPGGCNTGPPSSLPPSVNLAKLECRATTGSQFCAVSELTTTIDKRIK